MYTQTHTHCVRAFLCKLYTVYCFLFAVKKFRCFTSSPSFAEKLSRLPALPNFQNTLSQKFAKKVSRLLSSPRKMRKFFAANKKQYMVCVFMCVCVHTHARVCVTCTDACGALR